MDSGGPNGEPTNHDRSQPANGVNGAAGDAPIKGPSEKGKMAAEGDGLDNRQNGAAATQPSETQADQSSRMNDLPDEILHITQGFVPLSLLFTRLTQTSHNSLQDKINELANMQLPVAAVNGIAAGSAAPDDNSMDNIKKKASLLQFAQDMHARWVKALVIAEWSRKSGKVSKLIDLKFHIDQQRMLYDVALDNMANLKRDLTYARMPPPDLKTALQVLATGQAPWLPDVCLRKPFTRCSLTVPASIHPAGASDTDRAVEVDQRDQHAIVIATKPRGFRQDTARLPELRDQVWKSDLQGSRRVRGGLDDCRRRL